MTQQPNDTAPGAQPFTARSASEYDSATRRRIRQEVYGDEYPAEVDPRSYLTWTELRRINDEMRVGGGDVFIDLGCGHGGPGLWVAAHSGATVVGIDLSEVGVDRARRKATELQLTDRARFEVRDVCSTGLPDESLDAAMSVDTLWAVPDKALAVREVARVLKRGARFVFTNWDTDLLPPGYPPPLNDHRLLLEQADFDVEIYEVQAGAEDRRREVYKRHIDAEAALIEEMGEDLAQKLLFEAKGTLGLADGIDYLAHSRRIFVAARKG